MTFKGIAKLYFVLFCFSANGYAQFSIGFPAERAVFQRNNSNIGLVPVHGITHIEADRVEGILIPRVEWQGVQRGWQLLDNNIKNGTFSGKLLGDGGWYDIKLRALKEGELIAEAYLERIGIGEVFVVAGQSNAQGFLEFNPKGALDDRVNGYAYYDSSVIVENPSLTNIEHIDRELNIGPHGQSAWAWGELGDKLAEKFNVPILFFNAAFEGTTIANWVKSSNGEQTDHVSDEIIFEGNAPYSFLRKTLQNHVAIYGMRSIIWIQGEGDFQNTEENYYNDLSYLIDKTGADVGKRLNWIVSRTSLGYNVTHEQIIAAQNRVIADKNNVFAGPITDTIQAPRPDGAHFSDEGISELAEAFNQTLTASEILNLAPNFGSEIVGLSAICDGANDIIIRSNGDFEEYHWSNGSTADSLLIQDGLASAILRDFSGNYHISEIIISQNLYPKAPIINAENGREACQGDFVTFYAEQSSRDILWQDGSQNALYLTDSTEAVFARNISIEGCPSDASNSMNARFISNPPKPSIQNVSESYGACDGEEVRLEVLSEESDFFWSNGETTKEIEISTIGEQAFEVKVISLKGCESEWSDSKEVRIYRRPSPPIIQQSGPYSLTTTEPLAYVKFEWKLEENVINNETEADLLVSQDGFYTISGFESHQEPFTASCQSNDSGIFSYTKNLNDQGFSVYPNPVSNGELYLTAPSTITNVDLRVVDLEGRLLLNSQIIPSVDYPTKITFPTGVFKGNLILIVNYEGLERRFKLFFK